jgi:hypothetical protein
MMVLLSEGSFRSDRSSTLPKENNRFDYFSVSGSLVFSQLVDLHGYHLVK